MNENIKKLYQDKLSIDIEDIVSKMYGFKNEIKSDFVVLADGNRITKYLITNKVFCEWLNSIPISNAKDMTYLFYNCINTNNKLQIKNNRYFVSSQYMFHPVSGVNWYGALAFALSCEARLPLTFEWEAYACFEKKQLYPWGNEEPTPDKANYGNLIGETTPVDKYKPNAFGLYDMAGNLREWCLDDCLSGTDIDKWIYQQWATKFKIVKGGAWDKTSYHLRLDVREGKWPRVGTTGIGFRLFVPKKQ
jgi:formylglycine-generating enzyme required for sulfatase activity